MNANVTMDAEIAAAAAWWMKRIMSPAKDNGDGFQSVFGMLAASKLSPVTDEQVAIFGETLVASLRSEVTNGRGFFILACDYNPDFLLASAGEVAEIAESQFPWKVTMWIEAGKVTVRDGYGREIQTIFSATTESAVTP